jgi:hypothetical protein
MSNNDRSHSPLIERIMIIGLSTDDLRKFFSNKNASLNDLTNLKVKILEEYKSNEIIESSEEKYTDNIPAVINVILNLF